MPRWIAAVLVAVAVLAPAAPVRAAERVVLTAGHADLGPRLVDGAWKVQIRDDTTRPSTWRAADDVVVHAVGAAATTVPAGDAYAFLGTPGATVWVLPQVQRRDVVWLGWNTQDPSVATAIRRELTWRVHRVTGPGAFVLFLTGNFGAPEPLFDSRKPMPQESGVEADTHVHGNWVFTAPGSYLVDVEMSATDQRGQPLSGRATLRVFAGPGDPAAAFAAPRASSSEGAAPTVADPADRPWLWPAAGAAVVLLAVAAVFLWRRRAAR